MKAMASVFPVAEQMGSRCVWGGEGGGVCITKGMENTHCWSSEGGEPAEEGGSPGGHQGGGEMATLEFRQAGKSGEERYAQLPEGRKSQGSGWLAEGDVMG